MYISQEKPATDMQNVTFCVPLYVRNMDIQNIVFLSHKSRNNSKESEPILNTKILWLQLSFLLLFLCLFMTDYDKGRLKYVV